MPVFLKQVNFNEEIRFSSKAPIIINDIVNDTVEDRERNIELTQSRYASDTVTLIPTCRCGETSGMYSTGVICNKCGTPVISSIVDEIEATVWFRRPVGVSKLIAPHLWIKLKNRFKKKNSAFYVLKWITNPNYKCDCKMPAFMSVVERTYPYQRGYNEFVEHFYEVVDYLYALTAFKPPKGATDALREEIMGLPYGMIFSDYLPIPNKSIMVVEKTRYASYTEPSIIVAIDAIEGMYSIDSETSHIRTIKAKEARTIKAIDGISDFYSCYYGNSLSPKPGMLRKHVFASRGNFTFRTVITSITGPHEYDEAHVPWCVGVAAFREHLKNKLSKLGMSDNQGNALLNSHVHKYHPLIDKLLKELISDTVTRGIPIVFQRNPSLEQGSAQWLRITKFKTDVHDLSTSFSILLVNAPNADFDGDEMNGTLLIDTYLDHLFRPLQAQFNIMELNEPYKISSAVTIPKPVISSISNFLEAVSRRAVSVTKFLEAV